MEKIELVREELMKKASQGRISCAEANEVADKLGVDPVEVGKACDELKIKIYACKLGCF